MFSPRTGRPAVPSHDSEVIDAVTAAKRRHASTGEAVGQKFVPEGDSTSWRWPDQMDDEAREAGHGVNFPFVGEDRWIAVMHADISALGRFYAAVGVAAGRSADPIAIAYEAAGHIETAVIAAARHATGATLIPAAQAARTDIMPARPIVLGGDDVTVILRGDLASPFAERFLARLEEESRTRLAAFAKRHKVGDPAVRGPLTAAAGVAFGKAKQPFFRLLDLAEGLCGHAKKRAKQADPARPPSVMSFLRVTESALASEADELFERLVTAKGALHAQPYRIGPRAPGFVAFDDLVGVRKKLSRPRLQPGGLRALRSLLLQGEFDLAMLDWRRWQRIASKRDKNGLEELKTVLSPLVGCTSDGDLELFATAGSAVPGATPLFDALEWNAITGANTP